MCHQLYNNNNKVTGNGAIRLATYDFLLVSHCNYVSILHSFRVLITYFPKFEECVTLNTSFTGLIDHACRSTP